MRLAIIYPFEGDAITAMKTSRFRLLIFMLLLLTGTRVSAQQNDKINPEKIRRAELARCFERCQQYQEARLSWIDTICKLSPEQKKLLRAYNERYLAENAPTFEQEPKEWIYQHPQILDDTILQFCNRQTGSRWLETPSFENELRSLLTVEQYSRYQQAIFDRSQRIQRGYAAQITNMIDHDLYLTTSQREAVASQLMQIDLVQHDMYTTQCRAISPYRELSAEFTPIIEQLRPTQIECWNDLIKWNNEIKTAVSICVNETPVTEWDLNLFEASETVAEKYERAVKVRLDYIADQSGLDSQSTRVFQLAARGISYRDRLAWRQQMHRYYFELAGSMYASSCVVLNVPQRPDKVESNPLWQTISSRYDFTVAFEARNKAIRSASERFILAVFEQELWMTDKQRKDVEPIIVRAFERVEVPARNPEHTDFPDVLLLGRLLVQTPMCELIPFLSKDQAIIYEKLKSSFELKNQAILWTARYGKNQRLGYVEDRVYDAERLVE